RREAMTSVTADDRMLALLSQVRELAEVRDASGKVIGFFAPIAIDQAQHYANAAAHISPAEIQRRKAERGRGRTTREVFEMLKDLTQDEPTKASLQAKIDELAERDACGTP